ncbi:amidohydrolase [Microscilla marina]|uniref:Amidohydrolase family protein n=1 Tax=Microscilla marina ATCC 23134 TaxID=313606 RepID=A1ZDK2_MICM2|nr:amidohydrolase [Microscilla marina]EAY31741.1 amidohydrolase family protein [Microscilla marina ATCC 23134]
MKKYLFAFIPLLFILLNACGSKIQERDATKSNEVDLIVHNAKVYTVDSTFSQVEAFAVKDGQFVAVGSSKDILTKYKAKKKIDLQKKPVYPGFFDAHCHFYRYGLGLRQVDLVGTTSFASIVTKLQAFRKQNPAQAWLIGRGWDQNDWELKEFPSKDTLDKVFPDVPVFLTRVDGHAALANQKALDLAGVKKGAKINGGVIATKNDQLTGILIDNAIQLVSKAIPEASKAEQTTALLNAQKQCFAVGLTSVVDAGLNRSNIELIDELHKANKLKMRVYAMISATKANLDYYLAKGKIKTDYLHVRSVKVYADGALGSRGACLLHPYHDKPEEQGFLLSSPQTLDSLVQRIAAKGFQVNTHCIGDSANRLLLDIYGKYLKGNNDLRWRIEHAQVVSKADLQKFAQFSIIPSVQPTHGTSDMYWADERLGNEKVKTAYAYKDLLKQGRLLAIGSDFPVEHINPLYGFHAGVARQDAKNFPEGGFQMENAISREQALKGMTIWAAFSNFEENEKGSIEPGKMADFVVTEKDLMTSPKAELRQVKVLHTFVGGEQVYQKK